MVYTVLLYFAVMREKEGALMLRHIYLSTVYLLFIYILLIFLRKDGTILLLLPLLLVALFFCCSCTSVSFLGLALPVVTATSACNSSNEGPALVEFVVVFLLLLLVELRDCNNLEKDKDDEELDDCLLLSREISPLPMLFWRCKVGRLEEEGLLGDAGGLLLLFLLLFLLLLLVNGLMSNLLMELPSDCFLLRREISPLPILF
jgi:hypothetical protein